MKVLVASYSDIYGGAARAAYRIHHAVRGAGVDSVMWVNKQLLGDWTVRGPQGRWHKASAKLRPLAGELIYKRLSQQKGALSPAVLPSAWADRINRDDADLVHLHWVNGEMMSVADIGRIRKPAVWTLHDMWAFCGAEHYTDDLRWKNGYRRDNRADNARGFDIDRWTWERKLKAWHHPMHIVTPSNWLAQCVQQSRLMRDWPVSVIPNAIDTGTWSPVDKQLARQLLGLPKDVPLLLFGAMGGAADPRKGFDLLKAALHSLRSRMPDLQLVIFGQLAPKAPDDLGFPVHYTGHLHDDLSLRILYSAADVLLIPSRQDNLPNTGVEAMACATPVVAFNTCGLPDIVQHQQTGYLAQPFDTEELAYGIEWALADKERHTGLSTLARQEAVQRFSYPAVAQQYKTLYQQAIQA